ncbi:ABC transporter permease subunit [Lagierella sp.]|uniref:methionine ABC transporter permease n=1 Tax=Lagierella sp. TaxID=2849657 RepID=UPI002618D970|nr:ABC transporter permease subunit [Lagierella sp.]
MGVMDFEQFKEFFIKIILPATLATIRMVLIVVVVGFSLGFIVGSLLYYYSDSGLKPNRLVYKIISFFVNIIRSIPILLLIVALIPLTRIIVGTSIGPNAVIVPLSVGAMGFTARYIEGVFNNVDPLLIEAARSYGATSIDILKEIVYKESVPGIISAIIIVIVNNIAGSTIAGAVGGGGIGAIAINYGYQSFNNTILYSSVFILYIMVQCVQGIGNTIYAKSLKKQ